MAKETLKDYAYKIADSKDLKADLIKWIEIHYPEYMRDYPKAADKYIQQVVDMIVIYNKTKYMEHW